MTDGENAILRDTDSGSVREAILRIMEDSGLRQRLVKNARKTIEERFALQKLIKSELELYSQLVTQRVTAENARSRAQPEG